MLALLEHSYCVLFRLALRVNLYCRCYQCLYRCLHHSNCIIHTARNNVMQAGDHVNVTSGAYSGRRGTVVKVKNKVCFVFDEVAQEEFEVFARDLSSTAAKVTANADRCTSTAAPCQTLSSARASLDRHMQHWQEDSVMHAPLAHITCWCSLILSCTFMVSTTYSSILSCLLASLG